MQLQFLKQKLAAASYEHDHDEGNVSPKQCLVDTSLHRLAASPSQTSKMNTRDNSMVKEVRSSPGECSAPREEARLLAELEDHDLEKLKQQVREYITIHVQPERASLLQSIANLKGDLKAVGAQT